MEKIALFPGSFDPFTIGHESIILRALSIFDKIVIAIGTNTNKQEFFSLEDRTKWINEVFADNNRISVTNYNELTVEFCKKHNAKFLLRGLRTSSDFEYERAIAQINKSLDSSIETVFLLTLPEHTFISSNSVRDILRHGGDAGNFLPNSLGLKNLKLNNQ